MQRAVAASLWVLAGCSCDVEPPSATGSLPDDGGVSHDVDSGTSHADGAAEASTSTASWTTAPDGWSTLDTGNTLSPCVVQAAPASLDVVPLDWTGCGQDCQSASLALGSASVAYFGVASTHPSDGSSVSLLGVTNLFVGTTSVVTLRRVLRLGGGELVAALRGTEPAGSGVVQCVFGASRESALAMSVIGGTPQHRLFVRPTTPVSRQWAAATPLLAVSSVPTSLVTFDNDVLGGQSFLAGKGAVWAMLNPADSAWTLIEGESVGYHGAGSGDLVVWTEPGTQSVRGFVPDGKGARDIIAGAPQATCQVGISLTHVVGWATGADSSCSTFGHGRLWRTAREAGGTVGSVELSPPLGSTAFAVVGTHGIRTWGDYAVLNVRPVEHGIAVGERYLMVVRLSTWRTWIVRPTSGHRIDAAAFTVDSSHVYFATAPSTESTNAVTRVARVSLSGLEASASQELEFELGP